MLGRFLATGWIEILPRLKRWLRAYSVFHSYICSLFRSGSIVGKNPQTERCNNCARLGAVRIALLEGPSLTCEEVFAMVNAS
jgi:hypothetical protein